MSEDINKEHNTDKSKVSNDTWEELTKDWQAQPTVNTDIGALIKQTRRRVNRAKLCFGVNVLITVFISISFLITAWQKGLDEPFSIYLGFGSLSCIVFVLYEWNIRAKVWSQYNESPDKAIEMAIENSKVSMRYMQISRWSVAPFIPLMNWYFYSVMENKDHHELSAYIEGNTLIVIIYFIFEYLYRKRKKEYQKLSLLNNQ